jgi:hypothetical protein
MVLAAMASHQVLNEWTRDPREILDTYVGAIRANMLTYSIWAGNNVMIIGRHNRDVFTATRWSKLDVRDYVHERAWVNRGDWASVGKTAVVGKDPDRVHTPALAMEVHWGIAGLHRLGARSGPEALSAHHTCDTLER